MSIFQIISIFFAFFMMYVIRIHKRKADLNTIEISFWYSIWSIFIIIALFPNLLLGITDVLNFARVFDLLIVIAFMILSFVIFSTYLSQKETDKKIEKLIRDTAHNERLKDAKKKT
jgi:hypothetical protein